MSPEPEAIQTAPFLSDIDYLSGHLAWIRPKLAWKRLQSEEGTRDWDRETVDRLKAEEQTARSHVTARTSATEVSSWEPRVAQVGRRFHLDEFERLVLLVLAGLAASAEVRQMFHSISTLDVGDLIALLSDSLEEQVRRRRHFYRDAPLVREWLVTLDGVVFERDLLRQEVRLDRRLADFLLGLEDESGSLVDGGHLYTPNVSLDCVVLPERDKELVVRTLSGYPRFLEERRRSGLDGLIPTAVAS